MVNDMLAAAEPALSELLFTNGLLSDNEHRRQSAVGLLTSLAKRSVLSACEGS